MCTVQGNVIGKEIELPQYICTARYWWKSFLRRSNANKEIRVVWSSGRDNDERGLGDRKKSEEGPKEMET